ncbi:MAG: pyridoxal-phosphate dependent enzyme, partial [Mesorhizobium sp.]
MLLLNQRPEHNQPLVAADAESLGMAGGERAEHYLKARHNHVETPLHALPALADELGIAALYVKDEGQRLGLGSFKALGGAYAVIRLVLEEAGKWLGRTVDIGEINDAKVRE